MGSLFWRRQLLGNPINKKAMLSDSDLNPLTSLLHLYQELFNRKIKKYGSNLYHCYRTFVAERMGFEPM